MTTFSVLADSLPGIDASGCDQLPLDGCGQTLTENEEMMRRIAATNRAWIARLAYFRHTSCNSLVLIVEVLYLHTARR